MRTRPVVATLLLSAGFWTPACTPPPAPPPSTPTSVTAAPVTVDPLVGAVFLGASDTHTCTASVLRSGAGDLILTAAHCLAADYPTTFAPGFSGRAQPAWTVDEVYLDPRWLANQDPIADYAIARVTRPDGASVESVTGPGLTLGTAPSAGIAVTVTAYALGEGGAPIGCHTSTGVAGAGFPSLECRGLADGTSGAPWRTGTAVVGLIGGLQGGGCDNVVSYSPPFDGRLVDLLRRAETGGPGDAAPEVFESDC